MENAVAHKCHDKPKIRGKKKQPQQNKKTIENTVKIYYLSLYYRVIIKKFLKNVLVFEREQMKTLPNENKQVFKKTSFTP